MKKYRSLSIALCITGLVTLWIVGCDDSPFDLFGYSQKDVQYTLECSGVNCQNADDQDTSESGGYRSKNCTWYCGNYKGQNKKYVSLTFRQSGSGCWYLSYEYISDSDFCK